MNRRPDAELDDLFPEEGLREAADLISRAGVLDVHPDPAFRSELRRTLMKEAWVLAERKPPFWRRGFAGPRLAWAGAAVGMALIAVVAISFFTTRSGQIETVTFGSPIADAHQVSLVQPIELNFSAAMDQVSVERSLTISPATQVTYQWTSPTTVKITPVAGDLAPNTQYQLKIAASAATITHQAMAKPQTITFTTAAAPVPSPKPSPTPTGSPRVAMEKQLVQLPPGTPWYQWSPDGITLYFLGQGGSIISMPASGGSTTSVVSAGAANPALSPDGTWVMFVKEGRIQLAATKDGKLTDVAAVEGTVAATGWQPASKPVWVTTDGAVTAGSPAAKIASLPAGAQPVSIAPTGDRIAYTVARVIHVLELGTSRDTAAGEATFQGWTGDGKFAIVSGPGGLQAVGTEGALPLSAATAGTWESRGEVLVALAGGLTEANAAGKLFRALPAGEYQFPVASPEGNGFLFGRAGYLWSARITTDPAVGITKVGDDAGKVVGDFMNARLAQDPGASNFLDAAGKASYSGLGLSLLGAPDPRFSRWFTIYGDGATHYRVRLVFSQNSHEVSHIDEMLTAVRTPDGKLLIDHASAAASRPVGAGPEVIAVQQSSGQIQVSFDSDLDSSSLDKAVTLTDSAGKAVTAQVSYRSRMVTLTLPAGPAQPLKLAVQTGVKDVSGRPLPVEFDLDLTPQ